jgi:hypothetical protein
MYIYLVFYILLLKLIKNLENEKDKVNNNKYKVKKILD